MKQRIVILCISSIMLFSGCTMNDEKLIEDIENKTIEYQENSTESSDTEGSEDSTAMQEEVTGESDIASSGYRERTPCRYGIPYEDIRNNPADSIYDKDYYQYIKQGWFMDIRLPDLEIKENLDDYFIIDDDTVQSIYPLTSIVYDNRTIEMSEEDLKALFYKHGYYLNLYTAEIDGLHIRLLELQEIDGLNLYATRILMQTWDDHSIFAADITGPIPRRIRSLFPVEGGEEPRLIIHSSGYSVDYIPEEELSFWIFEGRGWVLSEMDLEIDTSHAHNAGDYNADLDRDKLFPATVYSDGIAYRPSIQDMNSGKNGMTPTTFRLGKLEVIEKNKKFRLVGLFENLGVTGPAIFDCYIEFTIK